MNKFQLVNRRTAGTSIEDFRYEWNVIHVAVMLTVPSAMELFRRYVQGNVLDDLGTPSLVYPLSREKWDGFASLSFETLEDLARSMEELDYQERARQHIFSDPKMVLELTGEDVVLDELDAPEEEVVKLVHFLRRKPEVGREQFLETWRDAYSASLLDATKGLVKKYVQNPSLCLEGSVFEGTAYGAGLFGAYGGIEELFFSSREDFVSFTENRDALSQVAQAGEGLVEREGSFSMVVSDRLRFVTTRGPGSVHCWAPPGLEIRSVPGVFSRAVVL